MLLSSFIQVALGEINTVVHYLTHQGFLQLVLGMLLVVTVFVPYLKWYRGSQKKGSALKYSAISSALATLSTMLVVMFFLIGITLTLDSSEFNYSRVDELVSQFLPQFIQVGTIVIYFQWFFFGFIFYILVERASNKQK